MTGHITYSVIVAAIVLSLVGLYFFYRYATRLPTLKAQTADLLPHFDTLLRRGYNGSFVVIAEPGTERFVQFAKYIKPKRQIGLQLGFPRTTWSEPYYAAVEEYLSANAIPFTRHQVATPPTTEFLDVDCGKDTEYAFRLTEAILNSIFHTPPSARLNVRFSHLSLHDEVIDKL